jgi:hypothetical protein
MCFFISSEKRRKTTCHAWKSINLRKKFPPQKKEKVFFLPAPSFVGWERRKSDKE